MLRLLKTANIILKIKEMVYMQFLKNHLHRMKAVMIPAKKMMIVEMSAMRTEL